MRHSPLRTSVRVQPPLFDQRLRALRRDRMDRAGGDLFLYQRAIDDLVERVALSGRGFKRALVIGCPSRFRDRLFSLAKEVVCATSTDHLQPGQFDLAISLGELETASDPALHLFVLTQTLQSGGMIAGAIVGGASLPALRSALIQSSRTEGRAILRVHPMIDGPALSALLSSAGVADAVVDVDRVDVAYPSLDRLAADLRTMGCTNILGERQPIIRAEWQAARDAFLEGADRRVERFELLHFTGWSRGEWQPPS